MDISKCSGQGCPKKERCWRFTAPASKVWQSYLSTPPFRTENGKTVCDLFWKDRTVKNPIHKKRNVNYGTQVSFNTKNSIS